MKAKNHSSRVLLVIAGVLLLVLILWFTVVNELSSLEATTKHSFPVDPAPAFLSEELAIAKAREALALDGFQTHAWQMLPWRTAGKAPDGRGDLYLKRDPGTADSGTIHFTGPESRIREYRVHLQSNQVIVSWHHPL